MNGTAADVDGLAFRLALAALGVGLVAVRGCAPAEDSRAEPRHVMIVGVDVSGSFQGSGHHEDALDFLAHYLHGHLDGAGDLREPTALFVGPVGGEEPGQAQGFHPIHDFRDKEPEEIAADLRTWFGGQDRLTDFNAYFRRVSELIQKRGLALAPVDIVVLTDGVPDLQLADADAEGDVPAGTSAPGASAASSPAGGEPAGDPTAEEAAYRAIDLSPLEYLSHSVTVRLLYPEPPVAAAWERDVQRSRVRVWTADVTVMGGWRAQVGDEGPAGDRTALWGWIRDNVDHPVRGRLF